LLLLFLRGCSELNIDEQSLIEISSLIGSLTNAISSRLQRLNRAKDHAKVYEESFVAASSALNTAKKHQADPAGQEQVIYLY